MEDKEEIFHELVGLANCLDFKYREDLTNEIFNVNWDDYESAKPILEKYLSWVVDPKEYSEESRQRVKRYLEEALADEDFDFQAVVDQAEMAFDETAQGDPRKVFEAMYKFVTGTDISQKTNSHGLDRYSHANFIFRFRVQFR